MGDQQAVPDSVLKELPYYKDIVKYFLQKQMNILVDQMSEEAGEEYVIMAVNLQSGNTSHLGSKAGKTFLDDRSDLKSQFLSHCISNNLQSSSGNQEKHEIRENIIDKIRHWLNPDLTGEQPSSETTKTIKTTLTKPNSSEPEQLGNNTHKPTPLNKKPDHCLNVYNAPADVVNNEDNMDVEFVVKVNPDRLSEDKSGTHELVTKTSDSVKIQDRKNTEKEESDHTKYPEIRVCSDVLSGNNIKIEPISEDESTIEHQSVDSYEYNTDGPCSDSYQSTNMAGTSKKTVHGRPKIEDRNTKEKEESGHTKYPEIHVCSDVLSGNTIKIEPSHEDERTIENQSVDSDETCINLQSSSSNRETHSVNKNVLGKLTQMLTPDKQGEFHPSGTTTLTKPINSAESKQLDNNTHKPTHLNKDPDVSVGVYNAPADIDNNEEEMDVEFEVKVNSDSIIEDESDTHELVTKTAGSAKKEDRNTKEKEERDHTNHPEICVHSDVLSGNNIKSEPISEDEHQSVDSYDYNTDEPCSDSNQSTNMAGTSKETVHGMFVCEHCGQGYNHKGDLKKHLLVHSNPGLSCHGSYDLSQETLNTGNDTIPMTEGVKLETGMSKKTATAMLASKGTEWYDTSIDAETVTIAADKDHSFGKDDEDTHVPVTPNTLQEPMKDHESSDETLNIIDTSVDNITVPDQRREGLSCAICDKDFSTKGNLRKHIQRKHSTLDEFTCKVCYKSFSTIHDLNAHSKSHSKRLHHCTFCDKVFMCKSHFKLHINAHNGIHKFFCHICGKGFDRKYMFEGHIASHSDEKLLNCDKCGATFRYRTSLIRHNKMCVGSPQKYSCDVCNKQFKRADYMKEHRLVHGDTEPYQCDQCGKYYKHRAALHNHKKRSSCGDSGHQQRSR